MINCSFKEVIRLLDLHFQHSNQFQYQSKVVLVYKFFQARTSMKYQKILRNKPTNDRNLS